MPVVRWTIWRSASLSNSIVNATGVRQQCRQRETASTAALITSDATSHNYDCVCRFNWPDDSRGGTGRGGQELSAAVRTDSTEIGKREQSTRASESGQQ
jgi:hypothetical protein